MKAAFYDGNGKMEINDYPTPIAGPGEVVVQIKATGITICSKISYRQIKTNSHVKKILVLDFLVFELPVFSATHL